MISFQNMSSRKSAVPFTTAIISALFAFSSSALPVYSSSSGPDIQVAGQTIRSKAAPYVTEDGTLYAPLDFVTAMGAKYQLSPDERSVTVTLSNNHTSMFGCETSDGQAFVPVRPVAEQLGGYYRWDDDSQTATILARILMVREDNDHLSVATSFPVSYKVDAVEKPNRVYIDVNGTWLGASAATVPVSGDDVEAVRSNQISRDRVRVVVDLKKAMPFRVANAAGTNVVDVALDPGPAVARPMLTAGHSSSAPVRLAADTNGNTSDNDTNSAEDSSADVDDTAAPGSVADSGNESLSRRDAVQHITGITYDASKPGILTVSVSVSGPGVRHAAPYKAFLLDGPERLALDLPGSDITLLGNGSQTTADSISLVNAMVKTIRWGVLKPETPLVARVVIDLYKPVSYTVASTETSDGVKYVVSIIMPGTDVVPLHIPQMTINSNIPKPTPVITQPDTTVPGEVLAGKTIVVDAGHGGHDSGAPGVDGLYEKNLTLSIAKQLRDQLAACGVRVIMTRADDTFIPLPDRAQMGIDNHADIFVSIHCDSSGSQNSHDGSTVYYHANLLGCRTLAAAIASRLGQLNDGIRDAGTRSDYVRFPGIGFSVLRHSPETAVLVEAGYVNSDRDAGVLTNANMQKLIAQGIVAGLKDYVAHQPSGGSVAISRGGNGSRSTLAMTQSHVERN